MTGSAITNYQSQSNSRSIQLRPFGRGDFDRLIAHAESPEFLYQWAGGLFTFPLDGGQLDRYLLTAVGEPPTTRIYTALDQAGTPVGHIELTRIDRQHRGASLARVLVFSEHRGQSLGRVLLTQALRVGFEQLGLHRIDLVVFDFNQAAVAAYRRAGMVVEGRLRDVRKVGDTFWSVLQMSMLEDEWRGRSDANR
jgi:RimJ/RimL family protein N-acetyltransferase